MHAHEGRKPSPRQAVTPRQATQGPLCVKPSSRHHAAPSRNPAALASRLAHYAPNAQRVTPRMRHASHRALCAHQPACIMRTHERARGPLRASQVPITNRRQSRARSKCVAFRASASAGAEPCDGEAEGVVTAERKEWGYYRGVRVWLSRIFWRGGGKSWSGAWKNMEIIFCGRGLTWGNGVWYHCAR